MLARMLLAEEFMGAEIRAALRAQEAQHQRSLTLLRNEEARERRIQEARET